jgi:putative FmdB family regulatory protein
MPIYEYECLECGVYFDRLQRFGDPKPETCPNGHPQVHRLLSQPAVIFKGSGFYVTDNSSNGKSFQSSHKGKKPKSGPKPKKETKSELGSED